MDISASDLENLKCINCQCYLSRSPVFLQHNGAAVCGQCYTPDRSATRNFQYETTAKYLRFPCKNRDLGCGETVPFVEEKQEVPHEEVCEHRQYACPVLGPASCDWQGTRHDILQHCNEQHPERVIKNPTTSMYDITKLNAQTFLLCAYHVLFLLHIKICVASGKIFHAVRLLGASDEARNYNFTVDIKRGTDLITKLGQVSPEGCLAIEELTALAIDTNGLLAVLGGFAGTTFTVTVRHRDELEPPGKRAKLDLVPGACTRDKHEHWFCPQCTKCQICSVTVTRDSAAAHYASEHQGVTHSAGATWRATQTGCTGRRCLLASAAGTAVCEYKLFHTYFDLWVYMPVSSERKRKFRCVLRLADPATGLARTFTQDGDGYDWHVKVKSADFQPWTTSFDVTVDIIKSEA